VTYPDGMRPKSAAPDLPPRMLRFVRALKSGRQWVKMNLEDAQRLLGHSKEQMTRAQQRADDSGSLSPDWREGYADEMSQKIQRCTECDQPTGRCE